MSGQAADPWTALEAELESWRAAGRIASFWWRDDDAIADTEALRRLLALRDSLAVPLALAVIPAGAEPGLAARLADRRDIDILQHGYAHRNHAPVNAHKIELGADRAPDAVAAELTEGWARLRRLFARDLLPVMVPPWNRIVAPVIDALPGLGYRGLSTFAARTGREARRALVQCNTHIDLIEWQGSRRFVGEGAAIGAAVAHLSARREGASGVDADEPTGLLTHHLAHDEASWEFAAAFVARIAAHRAARWLGAREIFAAAP